MRGLVVGRFQPLHNGHVKLIREAIEDCVHVTVGIGSSNAKQSVRNPFSFAERQEMVRLAFGDAVEIVALPDIHDPPNWVNHVRSLTGDVNKVFGNDDRTLALFEDADVPVKRTGHYDRDKNEATVIRMQMAEGDGAWRKAMPAAVVTYLENIDAAKRVRLLEVNA